MEPFPEPRRLEASRPSKHLDLVGFRLQCKIRRNENDNESDKQGDQEHDNDNYNEDDNEYEQFEHLRTYPPP